MLRRHTDWSHRITLAPRAESVAVARRFVRTHLLEHDLPDPVDDLQVVASELVTNAVRHARTRFTVLLTGSGTVVTLTVSDGSELTPVLGTASPADVHGRGLLIVDRYSDAWGVSVESPDVKSVWASFAVRNGV